MPDQPSLDDALAEDETVEHSEPTPEPEHHEGHLILSGEGNS